MESSEVLNVAFMTAEDGDDPIVSFAIGEPGEIKSLILLRTPKYEFLLDDAERGVNVSYEDFLDDEDDPLEAIDIQKRVMTIITRHRRYTLNVGGVDNEDLEEAQEILKQMNFDNRFELRGPS